MPMAPVDAVSRAIAELAVSPGSVGRAYHLVHQRCYSLRRAFELLGEAGLATETAALEANGTTWWAVRRGRHGNEVLSTMALYELRGARTRRGRHGGGRVVALARAGRGLVGAGRRTAAKRPGVPGPDQHRGRPNADEPG